MSRPNVVVIICHDLGDFLDCYGHRIGTANLSRLAAGGVVMANHIGTSAVCSPARGAINTGCYPHTNGLMGLVHRGWALDVDRFPPMPMLLANAGYTTHLFGMQHEHHDPSRLGYQTIHPVIRHSYSEAVSAAFGDWLKTRDADDQPFYANLGFFEPHRYSPSPFHFRREGVYESADPAEVQVPPFLPDIPEVRAELADFYGAVRFVDHHAGLVLDALEAAGLAENTLVMFVTDHGASLQHAKATVYDGGNKVACLMRLPGEIAAGHETTGFTSHVDILPTILELLDVPCPAHVQGRSFADAARGQTVDHRNTAFSEKNITNYYDPQRTIRTADFRYIRKGLRTCIFDFVIPELEQCITGFQRNRKIFEFYSAKRCTEELYDLRTDPGELNNLIDDPAYAAPLADLRARLDAWMEETNDPFLTIRNDIGLPETAYEEVREWRRPKE